MDEEYLQRQEEKTVRYHKRDITPNCIISFITCFLAWCTIIISNAFYISRRKFVDDIQVYIDSNYRDYKLTFDDDILA